MKTPDAMKVFAAQWVPAFAGLTGGLAIVALARLIAGSVVGSLALDGAALLVACVMRRA